MFRKTFALLAACLMSVAGTAFSHPAYDMQVAAHDVELLMSTPRADEAATRALKDEVAALQARGVIPADIDVLVMRKGPYAQVLNRELMVLSQSLLSLTSDERLFVLAHEASHLRRSDREGIRAFIADRLPSYIPHYELERRAREIAPELRAMRHAQELAADAFAYQTLREMGRPAARIVLSLFAQYGDRESDTHPSSETRMQQIRTLCRADRSC